VKQISLIPRGKIALTHGGELARGRRKNARPLDPKQAVHLVLRSSRAKGAWSMLSPQHCDSIEGLVHQVAKKWGVRVYRFANVGNHLHLLLRVRTRRAFQGFLRETSGAIAMRITGARKAHGLKGDTAPSSRGFWDHLAFTRIVKWGRDYQGVARYLIQNLFEAHGVPVKKLLAKGYRLVSARGDPSPPDWETAFA